MNRNGKISSEEIAADRLRFCIALMIFIGFSGCGETPRAPSVQALYQSENLEAAAAAAREQSDSAASRDKLVALLDESVIEGAAGDFDSSKAVLDAAESMIKAFEDEARVRSSRQAIHFFVDPDDADFRGHACDRIMLHTYKALDDMEIGDLSGAQTELNEAMIERKNAVAEYKDEKRKADEWAQRDFSNFDEAAACKDPQVEAIFDATNAPPCGYADCANPFMQYLLGLYLIDYGAPDDVRQGASLLHGVEQSAVDNQYLFQDAEMADKVENGGPLSPTTYVIFETGSAPSRGERRITFPLLLRNKLTPNPKRVQAVLPVLQTQPCKISNLTVVTSDGRSYPTAIVCDMDKVVSAEFNCELPIVVTVTLIQSGDSAITLQEIDQSIDSAALNDPLIYAFVRLVRGSVTESFSHADTRSWKDLPKLFCVARFPTPPDRSVTLTFPENQSLNPIHVNLDGRRMNFVLVKMVDTWMEPKLRQF